MGFFTIQPTSQTPSKTAYAGGLINCPGIGNNCQLSVDVGIGLPKATGFVGGVGADLLAIYGLGVTGFSGAGITSGLATLGSLAGGGMLAGVVVTAAAPLVAAVTIGTGIHLISNFVSHPEN